MLSFGKIIGVCVLAAPMLVGGCKPSRGTASPEDYYALIKLSLDGGKVAAMIGRNQAIEDKNFAGCVASDVLAMGLDSAEQVLSGKMAEAPVIPGFDLDLSECLALKTAAPVASCEPPAETASVEATEAATTPEAAPEAAPAVEEIPAAKPSDEILEIVKGLVGVALHAASHYATKLQTTDCRKGTLALAAIVYVDGTVGPIVEEITTPDGKVSVPAVQVDLSACAAP